MANFFIDTPILSDCYSQALVLAADLHKNQVRKSGVPYLSHLLIVSGMILKVGGNEDEAIAGLLHDCIDQDVGYPIESIKQQFGENVAEIVATVTEPDLPNWREQKLAYAKQVQNGSRSAKLVSMMDKFDNLHDYDQGARPWNYEEIIWFYELLLPIYLAGLKKAREFPYLSDLDDLFKAVRKHWRSKPD
jgi:(p)ppGpp synthase/HD superfamily hydrolase